MRLGYVLDTVDRLAPADGRPAVDALEGLIAEAVAAERAGFHSVGVPDRHNIAECTFPGPEQLLTILARETARVALGTFTLVLTLTHPLKVAEQLAVVDQLSRGRLFVTASRGFLPSFWAQVGAPQDHLLGRFLEALRLWREAFRGERFDFAGKYWQTTDGILAPPPFQAGGWPIWGGGNVAPAAVARSAEYAACWTCDPGPLHPAEWNRLVTAYRERAHERGVEPFVVLMRDAWVADSTEAALAELGPYAMREARFYLRKGGYGHHPQVRGPQDVTLDLVADQAIVGDPDRCREQVERFRTEYGVDYLMLRPRFPGGPGRARVLEQIARLGEEVVGPVQREHPPIDHPAIPAGARW